MRARFLALAAALAWAAPLALAGNDTTPPVTAVAPGGIPGANGWFLSDVTVALSCTDDGECLKTEFSVDGSDWALYEEPFAVAGDGIHPVLARSTDKASNVEATNTLLVKIDTVGPAGALTSPVAGNAYVSDNELDATEDLPLTIIVGDTTVRAEASDGTSGVDRVEFFVDGALRFTDTTAPYAWVWAAGYDAAGGHPVEVVVWDVAGHALQDARDVVTLPTSPDGVQATLG